MQYQLASEHTGCLCIHWDLLAKSHPIPIMGTISTECFKGGILNINVQTLAWQLRCSIQFQWVGFAQRNHLLNLTSYLVFTCCISLVPNCTQCTDLPLVDISESIWTSQYEMDKKCDELWPKVISHFESILLIRLLWKCLSQAVQVSVHGISAQQTIFPPLHIFPYPWMSETSYIASWKLSASIAQKEATFQQSDLLVYVALSRGTSPPGKCFPLLQVYIIYFRRDLYIIREL